MTPARLLVVCTGAVCRSPAAVAGLRDLLDERSVVVQVAGTRALVGQEVDPSTRQALAEAGVVRGLPVARQLLAVDVQQADLVIALAREHRSAAVALVPSAVRRSFTLRELARLLDASAAPGGAGVDLGTGAALGGPLATSSGGGLVGADRVAAVARRARAAAACAAAARSPGVLGCDDVEDPRGLPPERHRQVVAEILAAVRVIARWIESTSCDS